MTNEKSNETNNTEVRQEGDRLVITLPMPKSKTVQHVANVIQKIRTGCPEGGACMEPTDDLAEIL
ncbi:hypothetical protein [Methylobacter sp.]|uniref:hypothetical protein n=1 Tax=Methylobacter sp. TaxID=2051955 RepID=UPI001209674C|nr:hypothetical protein [Methylobacter sp.]TAK63026.1 MAG: hypothetical protein EPO18_08385 [Methylobacter sp.]